MGCDFVAFGGTMIWLSPPDFHRLEETNLVKVGGVGSKFNLTVAASHSESKHVMQWAVDTTEA